MHSGFVRHIRPTARFDCSQVRHPWPHHRSAPPPIRRCEADARTRRPRFVSLHARASRCRRIFCHLAGASWPVHVLEVVNSLHSASTPAKVVAFGIVHVSSADVSGVKVEVRRDTAITGRFRMESDTPNAQWPPDIVVNAFLAFEGMPLLYGTVADGAPEGKFVLRNSFGPRVLRCGYTLAPASRWWPSRVMLDGKDITNVPTDFSAHQGGNLEVVFTQHPARIAGTVTDGKTQSVRAPWILVVAEDRSLWQYLVDEIHGRSGKYFRSVLTSSGARPLPRNRVAPALVRFLE